MAFTSWLKRKYPELSANTAQAYAVIRKAKTNKTPSIILAFILVYCAVFYPAKMISVQLGVVLAEGGIGVAIYMMAFIIGSFLFFLIRNFLVKKEIERILKK